MKQFILYAIIIAIALIYIAGIEISIKPFYVKFQQPLVAIALALFIAGIILIHINAYNSGYDNGVKDVCTEIKKPSHDKP